MIALPRRQSRSLTLAALVTATVLGAGLPTTSADAAGGLSVSDPKGDAMASSRTPKASERQSADILSSSAVRSGSKVVLKVRTVRPIRDVRLTDARDSAGVVFELCGAKADGCGGTYVTWTSSNRGRTTTVEVDQTDRPSAPKCRGMKASATTSTLSVTVPASCLATTRGITLQTSVAIRTGGGLPRGRLYVDQTKESRAGSL